MSKQRKAFRVSTNLERGFQETISIVENDKKVFRDCMVPVTRIEPDKNNPREIALSLDEIKRGITEEQIEDEKKKADFLSIKSLAETIKNNGLLQPVVLFKDGEKYTVAAGNRRFLASVMAGKQEIEARIYEEKPNHFDLKVIQWVENNAREDLTLHERIQNVRDIVKAYEREHGKISNQKLAEITGLSVPQAYAYLTIINQASDDVLDLIKSGKLQNLDKAVFISKISSELERKTVIKELIDENKKLDEVKKGIENRSQSAVISSVLSDKILKKKRAGRRAKKISLGTVNNTIVAKKIAEALVALPELEKCSAFVTQVNWNDFEEANNAVKQIINILEKVVSN